MLELNLFPVTPSASPYIPRINLTETEETDEYPSRTLQHLKAHQQLHKDSLPTLFRMLYKNKNQLHSSISFKKITLVSRLFKRLDRLSPDTFFAELLHVFLNGKSVETSWKFMPAQVYLECGLQHSMCRYRLLLAMKTALMDAFRYTQQDLSKQLFVPVNLTFLALLSEMHAEVEKGLIGFWKGLYAFQRELCIAAGVDVSKYAVCLSDCLIPVTEMQDVVEFTESVERAAEVVVSAEVLSFQSQFWQSNDATPTVAEPVSKRPSTYSSDELDTTAPLPIVILKKPKQKKQKPGKKASKSKQNEIDNIFNSLF